MNLEQRLRASLVAPDPGAAFTARVMARVARGRARRGSRFFLFGALLVAGIAAAMLAWRMYEVRPTSPLPEVAAIPEMPSPAAISAEPAAQALPVDGISLAAPSVPELPQAASPHYSVFVMPLRNDAQDAAGRGQVEAFYSSVVEEIRKVPGIVLLGPGGSADYVLTITTLASRTTSSGSAPVRPDGVPGLVLNSQLGGVNQDYDIDPLTGRQRRGETSSFEPGGEGGPGSVVWIEMRVEPRGESQYRYTFPIGTEGSGAKSQCPRRRGTDFRVECLTPAQLAARQLERLRMQVFPPDAALQLRIVARLTEPGLTYDQRSQLVELLWLNNQPGDAKQGRATRLDTATLRALTGRMTTLQAQVRQEVWSMLRGVSQPELIAPLIDSMRRDADQQVRMEALVTLKASFAAEPAFKAALESVAQNDPDEIMRIVARRELYGFAQWRSDVLAIVGNPGLSYEDRLAPLRERSTAFSVQNQQLMQDQQILPRVVALVREHLGEPDHVRATFEILVMLSNEDDPLVSDLFAEARRKGVRTPPTMYGSGGVSRVELSRSGENQLNVDYSELPSNLRERMQEVTQGAKSAGQ